MKTPIALSKTLPLALAAAVLAASPSLHAQQSAVKIEVEDPKFDDLQSPEVGGNTGEKNWKPKDWLEVEVKVKLDARPMPKDEHLDTLTVKWYVAVENTNAERGGAKYLLMEKEVTHVNVPVGEEFFLSCYLSPATVKRLTGKDRAGKSSVKAVGGEITCPGAVAPARFTSEGNVSDPWWMSATMQRTNKFPLLNKNETPFKGLWWDRYLEIQPER
jgi:hypothetical protein